MDFIAGEILAFDKPYKWTSFDVVGRVRWQLCRSIGVKKLKVVYSEELPLKPGISEEETNKRAVPGSVAFVPSVAGLIIAGEVVKDLIK